MYNTIQENRIDMLLMRTDAGLTHDEHATDIAHNIDDYTTNHALTYLQVTRISKKHRRTKAILGVELCTDEKIAQRIELERDQFKTLLTRTQWLYH